MVGNRAPGAALFVCFKARCGTASRMGVPDSEADCELRGDDRYDDMLYCGLMEKILLYIYVFIYRCCWG